jgi:hypothetical protein
VVSTAYTNDTIEIMKSPVPLSHFAVLHFSVLRL